MTPLEAIGHAFAQPGLDLDVGLSEADIIAFATGPVSKFSHCDSNGAAKLIAREVQRMVAVGQLLTTIDDEHFTMDGV